MNVWIFTEWRRGRLRESSLGLLGEGKRVAERSFGRVTALLAGDQTPDEIHRLIAYGADEVIVLDPPPQGFHRTALITESLAGLLAQSRPDMILFCAGMLANEVASHLSVKCCAGLVTDAARIDMENGRPVIIKNTLGEKIAYKLLIQSDVQLVTIKPKELIPPEYNSHRSGPVRRFQISQCADACTMELVDRIEGDVRSLDFNDTDLIIAGGKGVGDRAVFQLIDKLSQLLGAGVAGSREAVDRGWLTYDRQIGQTGKNVSPQCLIALGISGAIQFLKGIEDAQSVVAINTDKNAPIFNIADLKIVGDLHEILPVLIQALERAPVPKLRHSK